MDLRFGEPPVSRHFAAGQLATIRHPGHLLRRQMQIRCQRVDVKVLRSHSGIQFSQRGRKKKATADTAVAFSVASPWNRVDQPDLY
jgi:hypothetical protein